MIAAAIEDRGVEVFAREVGRLLHRGQRDLERRQIAFQPRQPRRQPALRDRRQGGEADRLRRRAVGGSAAREARRGKAHGGEGGAQLRQRQPRLRGEDDALGEAAEELVAEPFLELADLLGDGAGADMKLGRRGNEALVTGGRLERAQGEERRHGGFRRIEHGGPGDVGAVTF